MPIKPIYPSNPLFTVNDCATWHKEGDSCGDAGGACEDCSQYTPAFKCDVCGNYTDFPGCCIPN